MAIRPFGSHTPQLGEGAYVDAQAAVIGDVILGKNASVWPCVSIRGDLLTISIGEGTNIQDCSSLHTTQKNPFIDEGYPLTIGKHVTVGHSVTLHGCTIEDHVLIGMGAIIMDGAHVESNVVVAAGTVVPPGKRLTSGQVWLGNPAQAIRPLKQDEWDFLRWNAEQYILKKNEYLKDS